MTPALSDTQQPGSSGAIDMLSGPILPLIVKMALPIFVAQIVQIIYNLTDTFWVGRIDLSEPGIIGGVGLITPVIFVALAFSQGLLTGISSLVARAMGEKNDKIVSGVAESGLIIAFVATVLFSLPLYLYSKEFVTILGGEGSYFTNGHTYLIWVMPTAGILFATSILNGILQGEGLMRYVMFSLLCGPVINLFLDPLLIFTFDMGVKGAAIATVIGQLVGLCYSLSVFLRNIPAVQPHWRLSAISSKVMGRILTIGAPQFFSFLIIALSILFINRIIITIDTNAMTAMQLWSRVDQLLFAPILAISAALITLVGQNAGAGNILRIRSLWRTGVALSGSIFLFLATVVVLFAPRIFPWFSDVPAVLDYAIRQTRIVEFSAIVACSGMLARATFQATGAIVTAFFLTALRLLILMMPFITLYVYVFNLGVEGVWYGMMSGNIVAGFISFFWMEHYLKSIIEGKRELPRLS